jgi:hypothetical protein
MQDRPASSASSRSTHFQRSFTEESTEGHGHQILRNTRCYWRYFGQFASSCLYFRDEITVLEAEPLDLVFD